MDVNVDFPLSSSERETFQQYFNIVDDKTGRISGNILVPFLTKSGIPQSKLGEIWSFCDSKGIGFLDKNTFFKALKCIALEQHGKPFSSLHESAPLPRFQGVYVYTLTPEDKQKYAKVFAKTDPVAGYIDGDKARNVFLKSGLPVGILGTIWTLVDNEKNGKLDLNQFSVAMFYIEKLMDKSITVIPTVLPDEFQAYIRLGPISTPSTPPPARQLIQPAQWIISEEELNRFTQFFVGIDKDNDGFISGADAVDFFRKSKLPEPALAKIWDLADTLKAGRLNKEQFALAMHFVHDCMKGQPLPSVLSPAAIPPSMRMINRMPSNSSLQSFASVAPSTIEARKISIGESDRSNMLLNEAKMKRSTLENGLAAVNSQRNDLNLSIAQNKAVYEAEMRIIQELESRLHNEQALLASLKTEANQAEGLLQSSMNERQRVEQAIRNVVEESQRIRNDLLQVTEKIGKEREEMAKLSLVEQQEKQKLEQSNIELRNAKETWQEMEKKKSSNGVERSPLSVPASLYFPDPFQNTFNDKKSPLKDAHETASVASESVKPSRRFDVLSVFPSSYSVTTSPVTHSEEPSPTGEIVDIMRPELPKRPSSIKSMPAETKSYALEDKRRSGDAMFEAKAANFNFTDPFSAINESPAVSANDMWSNNGQVAQSPFPDSSTQSAFEQRFPDPLNLSPVPSPTALPQKVNVDFEAEFSNLPKATEVPSTQFNDVFAVSPDAKTPKTKDTFDADFANVFNTDPFASSLVRAEPPKVSPTSNASPKQPKNDAFADVFGDPFPAFNSSVPKQVTALETPFSNFEPFGTVTSPSQPFEAGFEQAFQTSPTNIGKLIEMGFSKTLSKKALGMFDNDLQKATNYLVDQNFK